MRDQTRKRHFIVLLALALFVSIIPAIILPRVGVSTVEAAAKIKLNKKSLTITAGETKTIKLNGLTKKQAKSVTWTSSKKSIATVSKSGKITAKKAGKTTITAKYKSIKYKCTVTVKKPKQTKEVEITVEDSGAHYMELSWPKVYGYDYLVLRYKKDSESDLYWNSNTLTKNATSAYYDELDHFSNYQIELYGVKNNTRTLIGWRSCATSADFLGERD